MAGPPPHGELLAEQRYQKAALMAQARMERDAGVFATTGAGGAEASDPPTNVSSGKALASSTCSEVLDESHGQSDAQSQQPSQDQQQQPKEQNTQVVVHNHPPPNHNAVEKSFPTSLNLQQHHKASDLHAC